MSRAVRLKTFIFLLVFSLINTNIVPVYALKFQDISSYWAQDSILRLAALDIVNGYNGKFYPKGEVTRAEFAAMIVKAMGLNDQASIVKGGSTGYKDVNPSHWSSGFIIIANEMGIISGYPDGTFKPSNMIRRDEITSVLVRALALLPEEEMTDPLKVFNDGEKIPGWAVDAVKIAYNYQLISGFPDGTFNPARNATRGETAVLVERVLKHLGGEFTFYGKIQSIDTVSKLVNLDIFGQLDSFPYKSGLEVRVEGQSGTLDRIKPGHNVLIILDEEGYINFIETAADNIPDVGRMMTVDSFAANSLSFDNYSYEAAQDSQKVSSIIVVKKGELEKVKKIVSSLGGIIKLSNEPAHFLLASIPANTLKQLERNPAVEEISLDGQVRVEALANQGDEDGTVNDQTNPSSSINNTKEAIKAPEYVNLTNADGKNQIIAIIDTGVDAGHPDLQKTSSNKRKIVEWRDFTDEGDIDTSSVAEPDGNNLYLANGQYYLGDIKSVSGKIKYGYLREVDLVNSNGYGLDVNFDGDESDIFGVIVVDSEKGGVYNTVYVDTNSNKDFTDEIPLRSFELKSEYASFTSNNQQDRLNFVLTEIMANGAKVNLGFDGNDHGTHVAGIAAANGKLKGVAPGAQIMALKVLDAAGYGSLVEITEAMTFAASKGAKIINLSLGFPVSDQSGSSIPAKLLNNLTEAYGTVFVVAAGNDGPGLTTVSTPGDAAAALSVGAFNTPDMWKTDYGWDVPNNNLWFFSSAGPRRDGALSPSIVAPGSVVSTVPLRGGKQYYLSEGTSMAAPHVAGAIALLMEVSQRNNLNISPTLIKKAVESGATPLWGYTSAEQGFGALNLAMSWAEILSLKEIPDLSVSTYNPFINQAAGIFFREGLPQKLTLYLKNNSATSKLLELNGSNWVAPGQATINIPSAKTRAVDIDLTVPDKKGLFSTFISGDDTSTYGKDFKVLATVINPYQLSETNDYKVTIQDREEAAQYRRYFFKVPAGAEKLAAKLSVPDGNGRAKVFLYNPNGQLVSETYFAGTNPDGVIAEVNVTNKFPTPGVWEIVIYSSAGLSAYNLDSSNYNLTVSLEGLNIGELHEKNRDLTVGILPRAIRSSGQNYTTIQVRDRYTKRPYEGFLEVNGKLCFTRRGKLVIPVNPEGLGVDIMVRTVPDSLLFEPKQFNFRLPIQ